MKRTRRLKAVTLGCVAGLFLLPAGRAAPRLAVQNTTAVDTQPVVVPLILTADGAENALGWSLSFNPARLQFQQALLGEGAADAVLQLNLTQLGAGRLGVALARPADQAFPGGAATVLELHFRAQGGAGTTTLQFVDAPISRETVDVHGAGMATSYVDGTVTIAELLPPVVTMEPADRAAYAGANAIFRVQADSAAPVTYQWQRAGVDLPGETTARLVLRQVHAADAGSYRVVVRNGAGQVTSRAAVLTVTTGLREGLIGQWDFNGGDLAASVGRDLAYRGNTADATTFQTQDIDGAPGGTMGFPRAAQSQGYRLFHNAGGNGGGTRLNQYTFVADVMFPASSDRRWRALLQTDPANGQDAEFYVGTSNGLWITGDGGEHGQNLVTPDVWHRLAFVVDVNAGTVGKFVDGVLVHRHAISGTIDNAFSLGTESLLFTEDSNETAAGFVNSVQLYSRRLADTEIQELGSPTAEGLPLGLLDQLRPALLVSPRSQTVRQGEAVTLTCVARGTPPLTYRWEQDGFELAGETGPQLHLPAVTTAETGAYRVIVENVLGSTTSAPAQIALSAVERTLQPTGVEVLQGNTVAIPIALHALGGEHALSFSLTFDPEALRFVEVKPASTGTAFANTTLLGDGQVGILFALPPGQALAAGVAPVVRVSFAAVGEAVVTPLVLGTGPVPLELVDAAGNPRGFTPLDGEVAVLSAPRITSQPESTAGAPGGTVAFSVEVIGTEPLTYQWRFNGANLANATDRTLLIENLQPEQAGLYSVAVANRVGSAVSDGARLVIGRLLRIESTTGFSTERVEVPLQLFALGGENSVGASVWLDIDRIELLDVVLGSQATGGSLLFNHSTPGRVGIGVALPGGQTFAQGWHEVARLAVRTPAPVSGSPFALADDPVPIEVANALAEPLPVATMDGSLTTRVRPIDVEQLPDLVPDALSGPAVAQLGQPINIQWRVRNQGRLPAIAPWREALYVADVPDSPERRLVAQLTASENLLPDTEIVRTLTLVLPPAAAGVNYLILEVDTQGAVAERVETNNRTASANTITLRAPDLVARNLTGPAQALQGATINVAWDVANTGTAATAANWSDRLLLVPALGSLTDGEVLATLPAVQTPLAPAGSYRQQTTVTLPLASNWPPGDYRLVAMADFSNAQLELDEANNQAAAAFELTRPPLPDLVVASVTAPSTARPGVPFDLQWVVENRGTAPANAPWSEALTFVHPSTGERSLVLVEIAQGLAVSASVARSHSVTLPGSSPTGELRLAVATDARDAVVELNENNNRRESGTPTVVPKVLTLTLPLTEAREDRSPPTILATIARSGERSTGLVVNLANSDPSELQVPATVEIPAGRSEATFNVRILADGLVDGPQSVTVTATAAGHESSAATLTVLDVDVPRLTLTAAQPEVIEARRVRITVTREIVTAQPLTVVFESANPDQLLAPAPVDIPANQATASTDAIAVDDVLLEATQEYDLTALATGYLPARTTLTVLDNDVPQVAVAVDRGAFSEGDGPQAANATITRDPPGPQAVEIDLESTDTTECVVPNRVTIPANQTSISVPVAAVDDEVVDGDQPVQIRAFPLASASRTRLGEGTPAQMTVRDDDGPALFLSVQKKLVAEGLAPATRATVVRNTSTASTLIVNLQSSDTTEATVPASVVIPTGATSAEFPVNTVFDAASDGDQTVTLTASAAGFTPGEDTLIVSDRDLPDLLVRRVQAPEFVNTDTLFNITYAVGNEGLAPAGTNWLTRVYLSTDAVAGDDQLLTQYNFKGTLPVNQQFEQTIAVQSPLKAGNYWVVVFTDVANQVTEGLESNNSRVSAVPVTVRPAYSVSVATDLDQALAGTPVEFYGEAKNALGNPVPSSLVNIHITLRGTKRLISALTKADGTFRTTWQPLPNEAGFYEVGADHPGVDETSVQDAFTLIGMRADPAQRSFRVIEESSTSGTIRLLNLSPIAIHGLSVQLLEKPANMTVETSLTSTTLDGLAEVGLSYTVTALDATLPGGLVKLKVGSTEGAGADILFGVTVEALRPKLVATPSQLQAGILRGRARTMEFTVANEGGRESGVLNVALPDVPWMSLASRNPIPSLQPGESSVVAILLTPPADLELGKYTGTIALASDRTFLSMPYDFRALSEGRGDLSVTVVDEFTYYAEGAPKVAGATVVVRDPFTYATVAKGETGADGTFRVDGLMEGFHNLEVSAPKHTTFRQSVFIEPGTLNELTAFISRETVRYTWKVEPVEIEDHYVITIETEFETVVPTPVITVEPAVIDLGKITTEITQVDVKITNHGLIAADAARLNLPTHPEWQFIPLIEEIGILPARSSLSIPLTIRKVREGVKLAAVPRPPTTEMSEGARRLNERVALQAGPCHTAATVTWELKCGPFNNTYSTTISMPNASSGCGGTGPVGVGGGVWIGGGGGWGGPGGGGGPSSGYTGPSVNIAIQCDPLCVAIALAGCIPGVNCVPAVVGCVYGFATGGVGGLTLFDCAFGIAGCVFPPAAGPSCIYALLRCFVGPGGNAVVLMEGGGGGPPRPVKLSGFADALDAFNPGIEANLALVELILGAPIEEWVTSETGPDTGEWFQRLGQAVAEDSESGRLISETEHTDLTTGVLPAGVAMGEIERVIARLNRTVENWTDGVFDPQVALAAGGSGDFIGLDQVTDTIEIVQEENRKARDAGYATPFTAMMDIVQEQLASGEGGTCAKVRLRLEQEAVITRDAFQATLEIENNDTTTLDNIAVVVQVFDAAGRDASDLFGIRAPELTGMTDVSGTGRVGAGSSGTAKWLLIPTVDAAPEAETQFFVGGEFSYTLDGTNVKVPLEPVSITVLPTPLLYVKYFHQRDVFSDDPFTPQIEPSIPFNLAVLIENRGFGAARNMRITSAQPEIIENEKGLLIDFKIIATEVAGKNMVPSLTAEFGNIDPGTSVVGRWLMTSTLQGLFTDYEASFEHVDGLGIPRLSLIQEVTIHELVKLVEAGGAFDDGKPDFFVNQVPDALDFGDTLYLSSGETNDVELVESAAVDAPPSAGDLEVELSADLPGGWAYLRVPDPADGRFRLQRVERSDGSEIPVEVNVWVTDRTFIGMGKRPIRENILHLLDYDSPGAYTLYYESPPELDLTPPISAVNALPADSRVVIPLTWGGTDNAGGTGIAAYDVYVSENGGPFRRWLWNTPDTTGSYFGQAENQYAFYSRAMDAAGNVEDAPVEPDATTTVTILNRPPVLDPIADQVVTEGEELLVRLRGVDPDGDTLTYALEGSPPPGMVLNGQNGELRWATGEGLAGQVHQIRVSALDSGNPRLGVTESFQVTVRDLNNPPVLLQQADRIVREGEQLSVTNRAEDYDVPTQQVRFSLGEGAPAGMSIAPTTGVLTWRPGNTQGGLTYEIVVIATDNGDPALSGQMTFSIAVRDTQTDFSLQLGTDRVAPGETGVIPVNLRSSQELVELSFRLVPRARAGRIAEIQGAPLLPGASVTVIPAIEPDTDWDVTVSTPPEGEGMVGNENIANLLVTADDQLQSAWVPLGARELRGVTTDGINLENGQARSGHLFIVHQRPVLTPWLIRDGAIVRVGIHGNTGKRYRLEAISVFPDGTWTPLGSLLMSGDYGEIQLQPPAAGHRYYRLVELP